MTSRSLRIHRGFHRTGVALALIPVVFVVIVVFEDGTDVVDWGLQFWGLGLALGLYLFSRLIGWIIAGFVGE